MANTSVVGDGCSRLKARQSSEQGAVVEIAELGGLHRHYEQMAA
jgi:hypothetical protein